MTDQFSQKPMGWMKPSRILTAILVVLMVLAGLWVRTKDLAADPLDGSHSQQLFFLLTARSFQQDSTVSSAGLPTSADYTTATRDLPLLQWLDAKLGSAIDVGLIEAARIMSVLGWMAASLLLFFLTKKVTQPLIALTALALMVFMPFSIQFSRVVLPGSWALFFMILALWMLWRWIGNMRWQPAILCGVFGTMAVLLDAEVLFILLGAFGAAGIAQRKHLSGPKMLQFAAIAAFLLIPRLVYTLAVHGPAGWLGNWLGTGELAFNMTAVKQLVRLELRMESIIGVLGIGFALLGILLTEKGIKRSLLIGMWAGFGLFCLLSLDAIADSIYILYPLIFLAALSLAGVLETLLGRMTEIQLKPVSLAFLVAVLVVASGMGMLDGRRLVKANPEQIPVDFWRSLGQKMGTEAVFVSNTDAVTLPLAYYGNVRTACLKSSGCETSLSQLMPAISGYQTYFVTFTRDLTQDPEVSVIFDTGMLNCDAGSGVTVFPLTYIDSFCKIPAKP